MGNQRDALLAALDRLLEVDVDAMERMSEFQLVCVSFQTLLEQLLGEQDANAIPALRARYQESLTTLLRRINDLRDPNQKKESLKHFQTLTLSDQADDLFALRSEMLVQQNVLRTLRREGAQLALQLNERAGVLVASSGEAIEQAGKEAKTAVDRGFLGFFGLAILLLSSLIVTLWGVFRYHIIGRLSGMEKALRALSTGNFDVEISSNDSDPLAPLGRALIQVKENIRERARLETELRKHQEDLETQVVERTMALTESNRLLEREVVEHAQARQAAEDANKAKNLFLGSLSHELRTPLSGVTGAARLLRATGLSSQQRDYVDMITYANALLLEILEDMLGFSRIEAGKVDVQAAPFDLRQALEDMLSLQSVPAMSKGVALVLDIAPDLPAAVIGDRGKLNQILLNIIGNAIKFTDTGQISLCVTTEPALSEGLVRLKFVIADTGIGIPQEKLEEVFQPFFQVEDTAHQRHGGAGLGLAICRRLVQAMGGEITLDAVAGQGTTVSFHLDLPVAAALPEVMVEDELPVAPAEHALCVLIVEDDEINRRVCQRYLELLGHRSIAVGDGPAALRLLQQGDHPIDAILMDVSLPGMSGLEVAAAIRADAGSRWQNTPVIIMSAHAGVPMSAALSHAGYAAFLSKLLP